MIWVYVYLTVAAILYFGSDEKDRNLLRCLFWFPFGLLILAFPFSNPHPDDGGSDE